MSFITNCNIEINATIFGYFAYNIPLAQDLEWPMSAIIAKHVVDAQIDESRSYCEDKPHIGHLLSWNKSLWRPFDLPQRGRH